MLEDNLYRLRRSLLDLEKKIVTNEVRVETLTESVKDLVPIVKEISQIKLNNSDRSILEAIIPLIDEAIEQRSNQASQRMAIAIAKILPAAISAEIEQSPQEIAKAIAPEIAISIQEQIRLDREAISVTLGPEMGKAIKVQIEQERDAMVDALYPVIGNTISKYMVEVIRSINDKVEKTLSFEGLNRKIRAKLQGVSEAELILRESIGYSVLAVFLIHKASGLVIKEAQHSEHLLESDLLAGMLTAIRSFARDCIPQASELNEIEYEDSKILLEVGGYSYLAVIVKGEPTKKFIHQVRSTLSYLILKCGKELEFYNGDSDSVSPIAQQKLESLFEQPSKKKSKPPYLGIIVLLLLLNLLLLPWGIARYRARIARQLERQVATALDRDSELTLYRLTPQVRRGKLTLMGKVPSEYLRSRVNNLTGAIAREEDLEIDNQITVALSDRALTEAEIERVAAIFNRQGANLTTTYEAGTVKVEGIVGEETETEAVAFALQQIPGVNNVILERELPTIDTRIYFPPNSRELISQDREGKIVDISNFLKQNPQIKLKLIGHSIQYRDRINDLGLQRAQTVREALIKRGIDPARLEALGSLNLPPGVRADDPLWLNRAVRLETEYLSAQQ